LFDAPLVSQWCINFSPLHCKYLIQSSKQTGENKSKECIKAADSLLIIPQTHQAVFWDVGTQPVFASVGSTACP